MVRNVSGQGFEEDVRMRKLLVHSHQHTIDLRHHRLLPFISPRESPAMHVNLLKFIVIHKLLKSPHDASVNVIIALVLRPKDHVKVPQNHPWVITLIVQIVKYHPKIIYDHSNLDDHKNS